MIAESWPWKRELAKHVHAIRRRITQLRWPPSTLAALERDLFVAAYAVRKLVEAVKVSDEVEASSLLARAHPRRDRPVDVANRHRVDDLYDLTISSEQRVGLRQFCNQVIHSFVFAIVTGPDGGSPASSSPPTATRTATCSSSTPRRWWRRSAMW